METLSKLCYLLRNYATINTDSSLHVPYVFTLNLSCPRRTVFRTFLDSIQHGIDSSLLSSSILYLKGVVER